MIFTETKLSGCFEIKLTPFSDHRGWFARGFCEQEFAVQGLNVAWAQVNHSFTAAAGAVRGLHFQYPPFAEVKLIRCLSGEVQDIIVDLRKNSPTFLQHITINLSAEAKNMVYVPKGCAHGFQTLTDNAELLYFHDVAYKKEAEAGVNIFDPKLNIILPKECTDISERDKSHPFLNKNFEGIDI